MIDRRCFSASATAVVLALVLARADPAHAQPAPPRPAALGACVTCHGEDGLGRLPDAPHLAAQPAPYLERALRAYRNGERRHEVMNVVARPLSDADIAALAAWYAAWVIEVRAPAAR